MELTIKLDEDQFEQMMAESRKWRELAWEILKTTIGLEGPE